MTYEQTLAYWMELRDRLRELQEQERALRNGLFSGTFPTPREGVNTLRLADGTTVKGTYKLTYKLLCNPLEDRKWHELDLPSPIAMSLIRRKTEFGLVLDAYRKLPADLKQKVDTVLEIKPGMPELEVVPPKQES